MGKSMAMGGGKKTKDRSFEYFRAFLAKKSGDLAIFRSFANQNAALSLHPGNNTIQNLRHNHQK
jgi:hypothetical protein